MRREPPLIGLTTYREEAAWGVWNQRADLLPAQYAEAVTCRRRGARAAAADRTSPARADAVVARLDGLVISGGADVDPERYGAEPHPRTAELASGPGRLGDRAARRGGGRGAAGARRLPRACS